MIIDKTLLRLYARFKHEQQYFNYQIFQTLINNS
jgi:hypothetical protein